MNAKERSAILAKEAQDAEAKLPLENQPKPIKPKEVDTMSRDRRDNVKTKKPKGK